MQPQHAVLRYVFCPEDGRYSTSQHCQKCARVLAESPEKSKGPLPASPPPPPPPRYLQWADESSVRSHNCLELYIAGNQRESEPGLLKGMRG